ncbi:MAG: BLUF domain-containing protein [Moraxellaceae bacterium]|nr:BLUF domain-containing protein [Moraxellaceae bacterium]
MSEYHSSQESVTEPLYRMVYVTRVQYWALSDYQLFTNLRRLGEKNNKREAVTSVLCFADGYFLQYAEGNEQSLTNLKNRILNNRHQHSEFKLMDFSMIDSQKFANCHYALVLLEKNNGWKSNIFKDFLPFTPQEWTLEKQLELIEIIQQNDISTKAQQVSRFDMLSLQFILLIRLLRNSDMKQNLLLIIGYVFLTVLMLVLLIIATTF